MAKIKHNNFLDTVDNVFTGAKTIILPFLKAPKPFTVPIPSQSDLPWYFCI